MLRIGSLFTGIGGLDLGIRAALRDHGIESRLAWCAEVDFYPSRVLARHHPLVPNIGSVEHVTATQHEAVDLVCGGFPCQDLSHAGRQAGLDGARSGLWFEQLRIVEEFRPRFVVVENVLGLLGGSLAVVVNGLERAGYQVAGTRIRAEHVGAPHRRERILLVAHIGGELDDSGRLGHRPQGEVQAGRHAAIGASSKAGELGDALRDGLQRRGPTGADHEPDRRSPPQPRMGRALDGVPRWLDRTAWPAPRGCSPYPWEPPRTVQWDEGQLSLLGAPKPAEPGQVPDRPARIKALGNAVVPQVGYVAGNLVADIMSREKR